MRKALCALVLLASIPPCRGEENRTYQFGVSGDGFLPPARRDAYGPGLDSDATGRPFYWAPRDEPSTMMPHAAPDPTLRVKPDGYGLGVGRDQYGRPMERRGWD
ncbi:MAG: hypothetical protein PHN82_04760 [bacterium]|nr:hypothetical protein [bacterium]